MNTTPTSWGISKIENALRAMNWENKNEKNKMEKEWNSNVVLVKNVEENSLSIIVEDESCKNFLNSNVFKIPILIIIKVKIKLNFF